MVCVCCDMYIYIYCFFPCCDLVNARENPDETNGPGPPPRQTVFLFVFAGFCILKIATDVFGREEIACLYFVIFWGGRRS